MIIVKLSGGLGNQMFQYALGRYMSERKKTEFGLDLSFLPQDRIPQDYCLGIFRITVRHDLQEDALANADVLANAKVLVRIMQLRHGFHPEVFDVNAKHIVLFGNWANERYFLPIEDTIRKEFTFADFVPVGGEQRVRELISSTNSVCVHVRRADYVTKNYSRTLKFIGLDYYHRAIELLMSSVKTPHFYIFSDDIAWCQDSLEVPEPHTFIGYTPFQSERTSYQIPTVFRLMCSCRHFIIANSTFSWWPAWLRPEPGKVVIAPANWFVNDEAGSRDIVPKGWIRV